MVTLKARGTEIAQPDVGNWTWAEAAVGIADGASSTTTTQPAPDQDVEDLDGKDVPQRVLRKAETVLCRRTSSIILVIERCTSIHNYTALIRTAEALGSTQPFG